MPVRRLSSLPLYLISLVVIIPLLNLVFMQMLQPYPALEQPGCSPNEMERAATRALEKVLKERDRLSNDVTRGVPPEQNGTPIKLHGRGNPSAAHQVAGLEFPLRMEDLTFIGSRRSPVFLAIGMPTVYRKDSGFQYLQLTLDSFIENTKASERDDITILVFAADTNEIHRREVVSFLQATYHQHLESGFLLLMTIRPEAYPKLLGLKRNFNDTSERVSWRSKQVLDVCFTAYVGRILADYYMHMEDDTVASHGYVDSIRDFIRGQRNPWTALSFSGLYSIGRLFRSTDVDRLAKFLFLFYDEQPFDWLFHHYFTTVVKPPVFRVPTIFQNIGDLSSLGGKNMSHAKDPFFIGELTQRRPPRDFPELSHNPPAMLHTNVLQFQHYLPECAYQDPGPFFWGVFPQKDQTFSVVFERPINLQKVFIETGHHHHMDDILRNADALACYSVVKEPPESDIPKCTGCLQVGAFNESSHGNLRLEDLNNRLPFPTACLKIHVLETHWNWLLINQIIVVPVPVPTTTLPTTTTTTAPRLRQFKPPQAGGREIRRRGAGRAK